jgi:hypothetical protein
MVFWNLLDGGPNRNGPLSGASSPSEVLPKVLIVISSPQVIGK